MMLTNADRRVKLLSVRRAEGIVSAIGYLLIPATLMMVVAATTAHMEVVFEIIFFSLVIFTEVAICRTAKNAIPFWLLLITSVVGTVLSQYMICYTIPYSIVFTIIEIKMAAMKNVPGYPLFEDIETDALKKDMTADQLMAYNKKLFADLENTEEARARNSKNLDKILSGEMELDEFLGVEKIDKKNVKMNEAVEYHEPEAQQPEEDIDDDSAEAFFRKFEKKGGSIAKSKDESKNWLEGGDGDENSAESYFGKFEKNGGKLDEDPLYKPSITFDRVITKPKGGKHD